jgi:hypothetical protein
MRRALAAGCAAVAILALPAAASAAEVSGGHASDPTGDSAGEFSQDIIGAVAHYSSDGRLEVSATLAAAPTDVPRSAFKFTVASFSAPLQCGGASVTMSGFSDSYSNTVAVSDAPGPQSKIVIGRRGLTITFGAIGATMANHAYSCMAVTVSDTSGKLLDSLDVPLFFDGFGPDGDADGVADNVDQCLAQAGPAPSGCVPDSDGDTVVDGADQCPGVFGSAPTGCAVNTAPIQGPPGIVTTLPADDPAPAPKTCSAVSLKGKSLSAARKALAKAGCRLGKVNKPRKVKRGAKLVVVKQSGKNPVAITLAAAKRK